ncbi:MAG TPA: protein kinase [Thermoanaerobaculia bacterium]|nr:protein kinase [Thermoanaerobaculia bacterium]
MTASDRFRQIEDLFQRTLGLDESGCETLLRAHPDAAVAEEVRRLLRRHAAGAAGVAGAAVSRGGLRVHDDGEPSSRALLSGRLLGPYRIVTALGEGGMGQVYRARDERLERDVALKVLPPHVSRDPRALARFQREARMLAVVSHPNLVPIFDVGSADGVDFLVMELASGETLSQRLERGPPGRAEAIGIAAEIARGLAAIHRHGIVHRDLKPSNVILGSDGRARLLDFGLARRAAASEGDEDAPTQIQLTGEGTILGTPGYMAPEQVVGAAATERTDLFALGCVLYEMLVGSPPFARASRSDTFHAILRDEPRDLGAVPDPALRELVGRCLRKERELRPGSAREVEQRLREIAASAAPLAASGPATRVEPAVAPAPSPRLRLPRLALAALALVALAVAIGLGVTATRDAPQPPPPGERAGAELPAELTRLAVLPVLDRSAAEGAERWEADGVTAAWIQELSRRPGLRVISHASVDRFRDPQRDPLAVARALQVDMLLLGELRSRDDEALLSAELVRADDGSRLWGASRRGPPADLLALQDALLRDLSGWLDPQAAARAANAEPSEISPAAYRFYLQGRYQWNRRDPQGLRSAIQLYQQALAIEPGFALAHAGLADVYNVLHTYASLPTSETFPRARAAAERALELDPELAEALVARAYVEHYHEWDWSGAERDYRRALAINPSYASGWSFLGELLTTQGRFDEATAAARRAAELDPLSPMIHAIAGWNLEMAGRFEEALAQCERTLEVFPGFAIAEVYAARALVHLGRTAKALEILERDVAQLPDRPIHALWLAWAYGRAGRAEDARRIQEEVEARRAAGTYVVPYYRAYPLIVLGDREGALDALEQAVAERVEQVAWLAVDPALDPLRSEPRFDALLRQTGLGG